MTVTTPKRRTKRIHRRGWLFAILGAFSSCDQSAAERPNIILITLDTTRADHLSLYGYNRETSPNIDRFSEESTTFTRAYSTSSWTLPAHASLMTGLLPSRHGARYDDLGPMILSDALDQREDLSKFRARGLDPNESNLAKDLLSAGYRTAAFVSGPWLKHVFGLGCGFEHYDDSSIESVGGRSARDVTDAAMKWIAHQGDRPFFLFVNYFDPHAPYDPGSEFKNVFGRDNMNSTELARARYDEEILTMDHHVGRLLDLLDIQGHGRSSLLIVVGDHGEQLGENGVWGHGRSLSDAEIHVPLIVREPNARTSTRKVETPISITEVHSMILDAAHIDIPPDRSPRPHPVVSELNLPQALRVDGEPHTFATLIRNDLELVVDSKKGVFLFDVRSDPDRQSNLAAMKPALTEEMAKTLVSLLQSQGWPSHEETFVDRETENALRAHGYLGDD